MIFIFFVKQEVRSMKDECERRGGGDGGSDGQRIGYFDIRILEDIQVFVMIRIMGLKEKLWE